MEHLHLRFFRIWSGHPRFGARPDLPIPATDGQVGNDDERGVYALAGVSEVDQTVSTFRKGSFRKFRQSLVGYRRSPEDSGHPSLRLTAHAAEF